MTQPTTLPMSINNWRTLQIGNFVGTFDAEYAPDDGVPGYHVFVSFDGRVLVGPPQNERHENRFEFQTQAYFRKFRRHVLGLLLQNPDFVEALEPYGLGDIYAACGLRRRMPQRRPSTKEEKTTLTGSAHREVESA